MKRNNILEGDINRAELIAEYSLERPMIKDDDWKQIAGELCRVLEFEPLTKIENGGVHKIRQSLPDASVIFEIYFRCERISNPIRGYISHKIDFKNLWAVFKERSPGEDEEVVIIWNKHKLRGFAKLTSRALPGLSIMVFKKESFKLLTHSAYRPELKGEARYYAEKPIIELLPKIYQ